MNLLLISGGLCLALILLDIGLWMAGGTVLKMQDIRNSGTLRLDCDYRILCIGESTTQGEYPPFLEKLLNQNDAGIKVCLFDKGVRGTNTTFIAEKLEGYLDRYNPDMVIAMLGINESNVFINRAYPKSGPKRKGLRSLYKSTRTYALYQLISLHLRYNFMQAKVFINYHFKFKHTPPDKIVKDIEHKLTRKNELSRRILSIRGDVYNSKLYRRMKKVYQLRNQTWFSKAIYYQAVEEDPLNLWNWLDLASVLEKQEDKQLIYDTINLLLERAIEINLYDEVLLEYYQNLGWFYLGQNKYLPRAEKIFNRLAEIRPSATIYGCLGRYWMLRKDFEQAEAMYQKALQLDPEDSFIWSGLAVLSEQKGSAAEAESHRQRARQYRTMENYQEVTTINYLKIKNKVQKRGIQLVAVQYPLRKLEPLKELLNNDPSVIFVSNEATFKEAVAKGGYSEYFRDIFAGDFGHCNDKGNQLLAHNIATGISDSIFGHQRKKSIPFVQET